MSKDFMRLLPRRDKGALRAARRNGNLRMRARCVKRHAQILGFIKRFEFIFIREKDIDFTANQIEKRVAMPHNAECIR